MQILVASLTKVKMMDAEDASVLGAGMLGAAVMRAFRHDGGMRRVLGHVARQVEQLRDRLTGEMHTVLTRSLRILGEEMKRLPAAANARALESASNLTTEILEFAATVAGLAAENMVRGGGRLFLDFGRRMERAQAITAELAQVLDQPGRRDPAGPGGGRAAPGAGAARFGDHLSHPLSGGAAAGPGAGPDPGR